MAYSDKVHEKAFSIYRKTGSVYGVAKELGVHSNTIKKWRKQYNWDDKVLDIRKELAVRETEKAITEEEKTLDEHKKILAQYAKDDEDNLKILKAFKAICIDEINKYKSNKNVIALEIKSLKDATDVMNNVIKLERLIKGDPTEYTHHTISPIGMHQQERVSNDEKLRALKEEIDAIKSGK